MKPVTKAFICPAGLDKTSNKYVVLYKCPTMTDGKFITMYINNTVGNNKTISVELYRPSASFYFPFLTKQQLSANNYLHIWGGYVVMEPEDEIRITWTDTESSFAVVVTLEEEKKVSVSANGIEPYAVGV